MTFYNQSIDSKVTEYQQGTSSIVSDVKKSLDTITSSDPTIHAFLSVQAESALARAQELEGLPASERKNKPLLGVPVAVKDNICTKGVKTTCASHMLENFVPPYNATVVEALIDAGAIIMGKTNLDEFAMGSSTENSYFGTTRNPRNTNCIPGGSSGGSAAAVAAGMVPLSLGSDTGGSIRQPCGHCGVPGLKPTYGRVSRYGLVAFASSLDQIGPIANRVQDLGTLLSVLSVPDKRDSTCAGKPFDNTPDLYNGDVGNLTIGIPKEYFAEGLSREVDTAIKDLTQKLSAKGCKFVDVSMPNLGFGIATYYIVCTAEASSNLARYDGVKFGYRAKNNASLIDMYQTTRKEGFGAEVKRRIMLGTYVLSSGYYDAYYLKAARVRTLISKDFDNAFSQCDAVISPVTPTPAFTIGEKCSDPLQMYLTDIYTVSANLAGIPGISVPCGNHNGLPIGVQFMAPKWREDTLLKLGFATEEVTK